MAAVALAMSALALLVHRIPFGRLWSVALAALLAGGAFNVLVKADVMTLIVAPVAATVAMLVGVGAYRLRHLGRPGPGGPRPYPWRRLGLALALPVVPWLWVPLLLVQPPLVRIDGASVTERATPDWLHEHGPGFRVAPDVFVRNVFKRDWMVSAQLVTRDGAAAGTDWVAGADASGPVPLPCDGPFSGDLEVAPEGACHGTTAAFFVPYDRCPAVDGREYAVLLSARSTRDRHASPDDPVVDRLVVPLPALPAERTTAPKRSAGGGASAALAASRPVTEPFAFRGIVPGLSGVRQIINDPAWGAPLPGSGHHGSGEAVLYFRVAGYRQADHNVAIVLRNDVVARIDVDLPAGVSPDQAARVFGLGTPLPAANLPQAARTDSDGDPAWQPVPYDGGAVVVFVKRQDGRETASRLRFYDPGTFTSGVPGAGRMREGR